MWDANYQGVWHLPNGSTLSAADSTSHGNNGTINNAGTAAGEIDGGASFNGGSADISLGSASSLQITSNITVSAWINVTAWPSGGYDVPVIAQGYNFGSSTGGYDLGLYADGIGNHYILFTPARSGNGRTGGNTSLANISTGSWHYITGTFDGAYWTTYLDGAQLGQTSSGMAPTNSGVAVGMGALLSSSSPFFYYDGQVDEARISNTNRSANWIATEYNNQANPSAFLECPGTQHTAP